MRYRLPEPRRSGEAFERGERDAREGRGPGDWTPEQQKATLEWDSDDWHDYGVGFRRMQPAEAPPAWPVELVLIAFETAMSALISKVIGMLEPRRGSALLALVMGFSGMADFG